MPDDLQKFRQLVQRGAFRDAFTFAEAVVRQQLTTTAFRRELFRAKLRQGQMLQANEHLEILLSQATEPGDQLIYRLEQAYLLFVSKNQFNVALTLAEKARSDVLAHNLPEATAAEAERVYIRLLLTASVYHFFPKGKMIPYRDKLPYLARQLFRAGKQEEGFAALLTYANQLPLKESVSVTGQLVNQAREEEWPSIAAEALHNLAIRQQKGGESPSEVAANLEKANEYYEQAGHRYGPIEIEVIRANQFESNAFLADERLRSCYVKFQQLHYFRGVLNVLMDLSTLAHRRGDLKQAKTYRNQTHTWAKTLGIGIAEGGFITAQADLLMRNANYGEAIELCQTALAETESPLNQALYEQLLATAYTFSHNIEAARKHGRNAIKRFEEMAAIDAASDAVLKYAADLVSVREGSSLTEAEDLLKIWTKKDAQRGDTTAQIEKLELQAQIFIHRFLSTHPQRSNHGLLEQGIALIHHAEQLAFALSGNEGIKKQANLRQLKAQFLQLQGKEAEVLSNWEEARNLYERAGFRMEVANCQYIIGVLYLNRANQNQHPNFGIADTQLKLALQYYQEAGMRNQAVDTCYMLALLYTNASVSQTTESRTRLLNAANHFLEQASSEGQAMRSDFRAGDSVVDIRATKQALSKNLQRVHKLALEICCRYQPNATNAWTWSQRSKAGSLADLLGFGLAPPANLEQEKESFPLLHREKELLHQLKQAVAADRIETYEQLQRLRKEMTQHPLLNDYLELQQGHSTPLEELHLFLRESSKYVPSAVFVDWVASGDQLFLLVVRPQQAPQFFPLNLSLSTVAEFVAHNLSSESFRFTFKFNLSPFEQLASLMKPLEKVSHPDELLIFCPTGPMHRLPLHAIPLEGSPIIERNPIAYIPSATVLRHCVLRGENRAFQTAALFGDPSGDRPAAEAIVRRLAQQFQKVPYLKEAVTRNAFTSAVQDVDLIHFQGHAIYDTTEPLNSHLVMADGHLTAKDIFESIQLRSQLLTLAACESGTSKILEGDEPIGLIPAFLYAGANSILATLWKVQDEATAHFIQLFTDNLLHTDKEKRNKALAFQQAVLDLKANPRFQTPYFWASFALYGNSN